MENSEISFKGQNNPFFQQGMQIDQQLYAN